MPSVSKSQQAIMGLAWSVRTGKLKLADVDPRFRKSIKKIAYGGMSDDELKDFASTKTKDLPDYIEERDLEWEIKMLNDDVLEMLRQYNIDNYLMEDDMRIEQKNTDELAKSIYDKVIELKNLYAELEEMKNELATETVMDEYVKTVISKNIPDFVPDMKLGGAIKKIIPYLSVDSKKVKKGKKNISNFKDYRDWIKNGKNK